MPAIDPKLIPLLNNFQAYAQAYWKVSTKAGRPKRFVLNAAQQIVLHEVRKMQAAGKPVRVKVLKMRQGGLSTFWTAYLQFLTQTKFGFNCISIADKLDLPTQWIRRAKKWYEQTHPAIRIPITASNRNELYFEDLGSRYTIGSEKGTTPGMGATIQAVHGSEISNWRNFKKVMADLLPAVPKLVETLVALESTGEMEGDDWHEQVMLSLEGGDDYVLIFLPWWLAAEYQMPAVQPDGTPLTPASYDDDERELVEVARKWRNEHPEHAAIAEFKGIGPEHIAWRRWTILNEFFGDIERFKSRYPATIHEAFLGVGSLALSADVLRYHKSTCIEPITHFRLERIGGDVTVVPATEDDEMAWHVYEPCLKGACEYTIGGDSASGRVSDQKNERSERDFAALVVLNRRTLATSAVLRGHIEPDVLGQQMLLAAEYWNNAWIAPEVNNTGYALLAAVRHYPYIIPREGLPDTAHDRPLEKIGFNTTGPSRNMLISNWKRMCRGEPGTGFAGKILCLSELLSGEEGTFIRDKAGKEQHRPGCHDDVLFAAMLALTCHLTCPHEALGVMEKPTFDSNVLDMLGIRKRSSIDWIGGFDDDFDPAEGYEDYR